MNSEKPKVSVATVNYNHGHYLEGYIASLINSGYPIAEILIVDNHSNDDSLNVLHKYTDRVKVICNQTNIGYSEALNQAVRSASSPLVCVTGPDVIVEPGWLDFLVEQYISDPSSTFAVASRVLMFDQKTIQFAGGSLHFTGHLTINDMWKSNRCASSGITHPIEVGAIDSTSVLFDREKFLNIGGCDPSFFVYHEEFDYCYRARMRGWKCWYAPQSVVYHGNGTADYSSRPVGEYPTSRPFLHTRNRLLSIVKNYQLKTILGIIPIMLLVETLNFALLARHGLHKSYLRALYELWKRREEISRNRALIQSSRHLSDNLLLSADSLTISPILINNAFISRIKSLLEALLSVYWRALRLILY
jgi:GT2 family glycosyltransferase